MTTLTDGDANIVASYTYDAFGSTVSSSGLAASSNPYRYSTKEQLAGMYFYGYRFYSPSTGRWINRDPIRENGGANLYEFVENNPVNSVDLYGLDTWKDVVRDWWNETNTPTRIYTPQNQITVDLMVVVKRHRIVWNCA